MDRVLEDLIVSEINNNTDFFVDNETGEIIENKDIFNRIDDDCKEADIDINRYIAVSETGGNND